MESIYPNLSQELDAKGVSVDVLAETLNTAEDSLYGKLRGDDPWTLTDAICICKLLKNPDVNFLFYQLDNN